jgi:leucyl aminopeptidase
VTNITLSSADIRTLDTPVVLTGARPGAGVPGLADADLLEALGFTGAEGELARIPRAALRGAFQGEVLAVAGLGDGVGATALRRAAGAGARLLGPVDGIGLALDSDEPALTAAALEGAALGAHNGVPLVLGRSRPTDAAAKRLATRAETLARAVRATRALVNQPPNRLYPETFVQAAQEAAKGVAVKVRVLDETALAKGGYGGLVGVGQGSIHPPRLAILTYSPARAKRHVALVGKGITFDSGGLSLKPPAAMETMKSDMAGAAAVLHALRAAAALKLPVKVTAYLCLAENLPSGSAQRPSDVIVLRDGHAVEVTNTDAEGRLVLADGIAAAREAGADEVIDIATLTGAQVVALGNRVAGVMGTPETRDRVVAAADLAGEPAWGMPLPPDLIDLFKSDMADLTNANLKDRAAGMLAAGVFLQQFVGDTPWAHIDIAGPAFNTGEPHGFTPKGGSGFGVATLLAHLETLA